MREKLGTFFLVIAVLLIVSTIIALFTGHLKIWSGPFWVAILLHATFGYLSAHMRFASLSGDKKDRETSSDACSGEGQDGTRYSESRTGAGVSGQTTEGKTMSDHNAGDEQK